jgi:hypothetical protein
LTTEHGGLRARAEGEIMTSEECEKRAKLTGYTDRYYFDLKLSTASQRQAQGSVA